MTPLSFVIIGSGWRAMFYARIAHRYPELFQLKYMLCRRKEKAEDLKKNQQIPTTLSIKECEGSNPDFVVVAVNKASGFEVTKEWALKGFAVLCETPAGMTEDQLRELWELRKQGTRIQVAEQYCRYPIMAAGLRKIKEEMREAPYAVTLSVAHDYHGAGLIRHMLHIGTEPVKIIGKSYRFPVTETASRYGAVTDGSVKERERVRFTLEFRSGKTAFYDFSGVQYHSYIRTRYLNVQGKDWEWNDTMFRYLNEAGEPKEEKLLPYLDKAYRELETEQLQRESRDWNPVLVLDEAQDEYAIASMLLDMKAYLNTGKEVYPLAEALEDAYLWLLMQEALKNPNQILESKQMPWQQD